MIRKALAIPCAVLALGTVLLWFSSYLSTSTSDGGRFWGWCGDWCRNETPLLHINARLGGVCINHYSVVGTGVPPGPREFFWGGTHRICVTSTATSCLASVTRATGILCHREARSYVPAAVASVCLPRPLPDHLLHPRPGSPMAPARRVRVLCV